MNLISNVAIFMKLGGRTRNMATEPFEETGPEFALYGEFNRQIEQLISTKTESNMFRPDPHNKEVGKSQAEKELTQRVERGNRSTSRDNESDKSTNEDIRNYQNMVRAQAKQALADTIACDLYISTLGTYRKAHLQTLIDNKTMSPRLKLDKIKTTHWNEVRHHIPIIIANFKQQWNIYQVRSINLTTIMQNLNILQEINRQINNFDPTKIYSGLEFTTLLLPTLEAIEFNAMAKTWQQNIRLGENVLVKDLAQTIQECYAIQDTVTNLATYAFIGHSTQTYQARVNSANTYDTYRNRSNSRQQERGKTYNETEMKALTAKSFREGQRARDTSFPREMSQPRKEYPPQRYTSSKDREYERSRSRQPSFTRDTQHRPRTETTTNKPTRTYPDRQRSRSRDASTPKERTYQREQTPTNQRNTKQQNTA